MADSTGDSASVSASVVEWVLNGKRVKSPAGTTLLEGARSHGVEIPHFCYHPGLTIAGNCRVCLVETNRSPKPVISCSERVSPDLEVQTHSDRAVGARNGVMEFELINHPLDCPVCDKAGECTLQDYSYEHGPDRSRFVEPKTIRHTKDLGPSIKIWGNRCIVCTRCVRFTDEISGTGELCVVDRGDHSIVDVFPDVPLDNPLMGNTVDICPVGALISKDFMFQARVWYMKGSETVCAACARGCNVTAESLDGYLKRLTPRHNPQVNDYWMCDYGRYDYRYVHDDRRIGVGRVGETPVDDLADACDRLVELLSAARDENRAPVFIIDPFLTCEEMYLVRILAESLGSHGNDIAGWLPPPGVEEKFPGGFVISAEKAPNRRGAEAIFGKETFGMNATVVEQALQAGDTPLLIVFAGFPHGDPPDDQVRAVAASSVPRAVFSLFDGPWTAGAEIVFPSASPFEKEGTYVNEDGILQRVRSRNQTGQGDPTELQMLQEVQLRFGNRDRLLSAAGVFRELAGRVEAFAGLTHQAIPPHGQRLAGHARPAAKGKRAP